MLMSAADHFDRNFNRSSTGFAVMGDDGNPVLATSSILFLARDDYWSTIRRMYIEYRLHSDNGDAKLVSYSRDALGNEAVAAISLDDFRRIPQFTREMSAAIFPVLAEKRDDGFIVVVEPSSGSPSVLLILLSD